MRMGRRIITRRRFHRQSDTVRQSAEWHCELAQSQGKPTIAIGGTVTRDPHTIEALNETGIVATFGIAPGPADLATLIANTERNVEITCAAIASTLRITAATSPCESA